MNRELILVAMALAMTVAGAGELTAKIAAGHTVKSTDVWYGGERTVFDFEGYEAWVVEPPAGVKAAEGRPWTWTMQWKSAYVPRTSVPRLLRRGWHHVTIDTFTNRMDAAGLAVSARFQEFLVKTLGLAPKANLIGMSWGGFFSTRYAAAHPANVAHIYLDAPLLNFEGFAPDPSKTPTAAASRIGPWAQYRPQDGWTKDPEMPINKAEAIARAGIPVLLLYGGQDQTVAPKLNCLVFAERFKAAGGSIKVVPRGCYGHHPHGVELDEMTIIDFFGN